MASEQEITDFPVEDMDNSVTALTQVSNEAKKPLKSDSNILKDNEVEGSIVASSEKESKDSGRVMFRGVDMAFLTINGIQMFTLYEIKRNFCPDSKPGTVGNRFTRLDATRHACSREEIVKVKELGGTSQKFYNCSLVAREDVERYCDKYVNKNEAQTKPRSSKREKKVTKKSTSDQESKDIDSVSAVVVSSGDLVLEETETENMTQDLTCDNNWKDDEECCTKAKSKQNNNTSLKVTDDHAKANKKKKRIVKKQKKQIITKDRPSLVKGNPRSKKPTSKSVLSALGAKSLSILKKKMDNSLLEGSAVATNNSVSEQNTATHLGDGKSANWHSRKRKRRTQFELLQTQSYSVVSDDDIHKRCRKTSLSDADNIIDDKKDSPEKLLWQETKFDYDNLDLPYLDENNNASVPRSPTLLLKRLQNNKWRVAKAVLPELSFDNAESDDKSDSEIKLKNTKNSGEEKKLTAMTKVKDKRKVKPNRKLSKATTKERSGKKTKIDEDELPLALRKDFRKKKCLKKINQTNKPKSFVTTVRKQDETSNFEGKLYSNINTTDIIAKQVDTPVKVQPKNPEGRKNSVLFKDSVESTSKTPDYTENKVEHIANSDSKVVKKKRKRRTQDNTFRLIETIPYPSSLIVKDGDICPSFSMAYSERNYLPGCCHPLWRWRLGKPVRIPSQSPVMTNQDAQRCAQDAQNHENEVMSSMKMSTEDDVTKEEIFIDVQNVSVLSETLCVGN